MRRMRCRPPPARPDVPAVRRGWPRLPGGRRDRGGVQLRGAPSSAGAGPEAADRDCARHPDRGGPDGGRAAGRGPGRCAHRPAGPGGLCPGGCGSDAPRLEAGRLEGGPAMTVEAGQALPELVIDVTPTFVVAGAIATRDFQDVHHDRARAAERGGKDIFVNILTTTGLVQRYVTDWAGPDALVRKIAIRLGAPCYAGDTLTFSGRVAAGTGPGDTGAGGGEYVVEVTGRCSLGDHVTGTVHLAVAGSTA